jgi:Trm5-related predicted tRNA methylase
MSRKANASMDDGTVIQDPSAMSAALMTEERAYMAKWLALEILMTDETVCEDEELYGQLWELQEKWQEETLAKYGVTPAP